MSPLAHCAFLCVYKSECTREKPQACMWKYILHMVANKVAHKVQPRLIDSTCTTRARSRFPCLASVCLCVCVCLVQQVFGGTTKSQRHKVHTAHTRTPLCVIAIQHNFAFNILHTIYTHTYTRCCFICVSMRGQCTHTHSHICLRTTCANILYT